MDRFSYDTGPFFSEKIDPGGTIFPEKIGPGPKFSAEQNFRDSPPGQLMAGPFTDVVTELKFVF